MDRFPASSDAGARIASAVDAYRRGLVLEAIAQYRSILADTPDDVDAHQLLGLALHRAGQAREGLAHLDRALEIDPHHAGAWFNRAQALLALERPVEAEQSALRAVSADATLGGARLLLARLRLAREDLDGAADAARPLRALPEGRLILGLVALARSDAADAAALLDDLPLPADLLASVGGALLGSGDPNRAAAWLGRALRAGADQRVRIAWADALMLATSPPVDQADLLLDALNRHDLDHQRLDSAIRATLEADPSIAGWLDGAPGPPDHPLLVPWLRRLIVQSPRWQERLAALGTEDLPLATLEALAVQMTLTGWAWPAQSRCERVTAPSLEDPIAVARWALHHDPTVLGHGPWTAALPHLAAASIVLHEEEAAEEIPVLSLTDDPVSAAVRAQYEADPYPRLFSVHLGAAVSLSAFLRARGIEIDAPDAPEVLIAGCGTGQHPLQSASSWTKARILAVDLSRRSLARAARRIRQLGMSDRIRLFQADLLALDGLGTFDVVESVGVLHHLADPLAGWRALRDRVRPGGLMRIGLYSERGRAEVVASRALMTAHGLGTAPDDLRRARRLLLDLPPEHPAFPITRSPDFHSLAGLRDLVFHACEHRFDLPTIAAALEDLGLSFLGFQHARTDLPPIPPRDLTAWANAENARPDLFRGLYVFWCQRR